MCVFLQNTAMENENTVRITSGSVLRTTLRVVRSASPVCVAAGFVKNPFFAECAAFEQARKCTECRGRVHPPGVRGSATLG